MSSPQLGRESGGVWLSLLFLSSPQAEAWATATSNTSLLLCGQPERGEELATRPSLLSQPHPSRKKQNFEGVCGIPHWVGSGPAGASLEWGNPRCASYCSELRSGEHSFLPEESQGEEVRAYLRTPELLPQHWWGERSHHPPPRGTGTPTWLLALWSAQALTSMSMIWKLPNQAARWITVKPCFPKKREEENPLSNELPHSVSGNKSLGDIRVLEK